MNRTFINTKDYECYYFSLKDIMSKKSKGPLKTLIIQELEKQHPAFDLNSAFFYKFTIKENKIFVIVFVIDAQILLEYEQKAKRIYIREGKVYRISNNFFDFKQVIVFFALSIIMLVLVSFYAINFKSTKVVSQNNEIVQEQAIIEEKCSFDEFCNILLEIKKNNDFSVSNLIIEQLLDTAYVAVSFFMHSIYPEQLFGYFKHENDLSIAIDSIEYVNNKPSFTAQGIFKVDSKKNQENNLLISIRTLLKNSGSLLKNENYETNEIHAELANTTMLAFLDATRKNDLKIPISKISLINQDSEITNLYMQLGKEGSFLFEQESFLQVVEQFFYKKPPQQAIKPKQQPKSVQVIEHGEIVGKIVLEDGKIKTFYKDQDGKFYNEVK